MEFKTSSYRSGLIGLIVVAALAAGAVGLGRLLISRAEVSWDQPLPPLVLGLSLALLLDVILVILLLYWSVAALRLRYRLDRNGLVIYWGASKLLVPMERIQDIVAGGELNSGHEGPAAWRAFRGVGWAGLRAGRARLTDGRPARVFTTTSLAQGTVVLTPDYAYVISPQDGGAFMEAWRARRSLGPTRNWREEEQRARFLKLPIWRDRLAWTLIGLGLLANLALQGYLTSIFDRLPTILSFHFDLLGQADRIADRSEVLRLPHVALLVLVLDLGLGLAVYRRQRVAAYLVWGGGLLLQWLTWAAVLTITR